MTHSLYNQDLGNAHKSLEDIVRYDELLQNGSPNLESFHYILKWLITKYTLNVNKLSQCYNISTQPQKRVMIQKLIDATIGRILELKDQLLQIDLDIISYRDDVFEDLKITPFDAEIILPEYFKTGRRSNVLEGRNILKEKFGFNFYTWDDPQHEEQSEAPKMSTEEAVRLLQRHQRARLGRLKFSIAKVAYMRIVQGRKTFRQYDKEDGKAALMIQKVWRGYKVRKRMNEREIQELILLGMLPPPNYPHKQRQRYEKVKDMKRRMGKENKKEYEEATINIMERLRSQKATRIVDTMKNQVRQWYTDTYNETKTLPDYPTDEQGGCKAILNRKPEEKGTEKAEIQKVPTKKGNKERGKGKKKDKDVATKLVIQQSLFTPKVKEANEEYTAIWRSKIETSDLEEKYYADFIQEQKQKELEEELRVTVDQLMRQELELLKAAIEKSRKGKGKKKKKRGKKSKKGKGKKKRKDLTQDRTTESLLEELVENKIIQQHKNVSLSEFQGEHNYLGLSLRLNMQDPLPYTYDVKETLRELCILPLGSPDIRASAPLIRSAIIAGPSDCGKTMLVNAVCTELGAVLFDLTPSRMEGLYTSKEETTMLQHLVEKVSRLVQPSIILVDTAEKLSQSKKIPPEEKPNLKRLKTMFLKIVKGITKEDQVMVIGTSSAPWMGKNKPMSKTFDRFIYLPKPEYSTLYQAWHKEIRKHPGISPLTDISALAKISVGYTIPIIQDIMNKMMTTERILSLKVKPVRYQEIAEALAQCVSIDPKDELKYVKWYNNSTLAKKKKQATGTEKPVKKNK